MPRVADAVCIDADELKSERLYRAMHGLELADEVKPLEMQPVADAVRGFGAFAREIGELRFLLRLAGLLGRLLKAFHEAAHGVHDRGYDWRRLVAR